ncbi:RING-type domain-containing protein [Mycena chlorophos]|uniref:RING-type domain-containing protein n=1 Tax=Mycena chlorophos TaxID=658473 RepID=A0A8H6RXB7_MYCCL|nr:RING-type domain-containing protein [Mycena chlorophos]
MADLRRTHSEPAPASSIATPAPVHLPSPTHSDPNPVPPSPPATDPAPAAPTPAPPRTLLGWLGVGRSASPARKKLLSLWYNLVWGFVQIVLIVTFLSVAAETRSPTRRELNELQSCTTLASWAGVYIVRVLFSTSLTYWGWRRDRIAHAARAGDAENRQSNASATPPVPSTATTNTGSATQHPSSEATAQVALPHTVLYSRLSILSSMFTLTWFLTAHILEYSAIHTCRYSAPHVFWLLFGILCIMYLVVLEVLLLGFVVFVVAPIVFLVWNVALILLGRHPMQHPMANVIRPEIGKLPQSVVAAIPLVTYVPAPPDAEPGSIPLPQAVYSYPPKPSAAPPPRKHRFRFLRRSNKSAEAPEASPSLAQAPKDPNAPQSWEDHWEQTGYPFVVLENNRATCAICLMDFEEPKRVDGHSAGEAAPATSSGIQEVPVEPNEASQGDTLPKLEDAGEGSQPLRLLACGHCFHQSCIDPWLTDVSGRCPVCQRPVEIPAPTKNKRRRT